MHRISVLRDDVIFVLYLIQRRMYKVDAERPAEGYEVDAGEAPAEEEAPGPSAEEAEGEGGEGEAAEEVAAALE